MRFGWLGLVCWLASCVFAQAQTPSALLDEGMRLLAQRDFDGAERVFVRALEQSRLDAARLAEGQARYGLGKVFLGKAVYPDARRELTAALAIFEQVGDRTRTGLVRKDIGFVAWAEGNRPEALGLYRLALADFEAVGNLQERASLLYNLAFASPPGEERNRWLQLSLEGARQTGNRRLEGLVLHLWGDTDFAAGDYAAAASRLDQAAALLDAPETRRELARVYTSLGRLFRFHQRPERSLEFNRKALEIQEQVADRQGVIQSLDAMAIAYQALGQRQPALDAYGRALSLARQTGSAALVGRQLAHLASMHNELGEFAMAVELLEEASRELKQPSSREFMDLSLAYRGLGRHADALVAADRSVDLARRAVAAADSLADALLVRARAKVSLGDLAGASADAEEGLRSIERQRTLLVPTDYMKGGYGARSRQLAEFLVDVLHRGGHDDRAFEAAEHDRARAFLDLLATRALEPARGADAQTAQPWDKWQRTSPDLKSLVSTAPFTVAQAEAAAARLGSTLVAYWVGSQATYVWVVRPGAPVRGARVEVGSDQLRQWTAATLANGPGRAVSGGGSPAVGPAAREPWRRLYDTLIRPVRDWLPTEAGSRLTLVPHGPLFAIPFAALVDDRGRYLIERYAMHTVPAAAVLEFTGRRRRDGTARPARYLLVADPSRPPAAPDGQALPPLPGARLEVQEIARGAAAGTVTTLLGHLASESAFRTLAAGHTVIHLATHGIVRDDRPFDSFLALADGGRLTAQDVYGLDLSADLVVLSGCRTGLGPITGDGIVGLTRAFFYAGTPTVVATVWEVADEPTRRLMTAFYAGVRRTGDKARALRDAQLQLLKALRQGQVRVATPLGRVSLPEDPRFWAAFVLLGEP